MKETEAGLLVPDSTPLPEVEKIEKKWPGYAVDAFDKASQILINQGITFMAVCPECGRTGKNGVMTAYALEGIVFLECDCTIHVLAGPKMRKRMRKAAKLERE